MFQKRLQDCADQTAAILENSINAFEAVPVTQAMAHAVGGGKRMRAFLVMESARVYDVPDSQSVIAAAAVEAMHAYSLIHDDLPCMDDDALRRGQPTVHVKWDDATAVLAGDGLQSLAYGFLGGTELKVDPSVKVELIASLAKATGAAGMVMGQAQDIAAETAEHPLTLDEITNLQANKTGALIEWSACAGAVLAGKDTTAMRVFSRAIGLAFQISDDILDVEGDATKAGKQVGKDAKAGKATFVSLLGMDGAKQRARELIDTARQAMEPFGKDGDALREAAEFVISREM